MGVRFSGSGGLRGRRTRFDQSLGGFGYGRFDQSLGGFGYRRFDQSLGGFGYRGKFDFR